MLATIPPGHPGTKQKRIRTVFFGLWHGPCERHEGGSRQHQSRIMDTSGGIVYTIESHPELKVGDRVRFRMGFDKLGIEQLAIGVEPVAPVATISDAKIAPPKRKK
jgi:hypothetical protein